MKLLRGFIFFLVCFGCSTKLVLAQTSADGYENIDFSIPKTVYFGGERVWISCEAIHNDLPAESKIIYAELVDRYNEPVAIAKIPLEDGKGFNFLKLPTNLPSDNY